MPQICKLSAIDLPNFLYFVLISLFFFSFLFFFIFFCFFFLFLFFLLCYFMLCYFMLFYSVLFYVILCYVILLILASFMCNIWNYKHSSIFYAIIKFLPVIFTIRGLYIILHGICNI